MNDEDSFWNELKDDWTGRIYNGIFQECDDWTWFTFEVIKDDGTTVTCEKTYSSSSRKMQRKAVPKNYIVDLIKKGRVERLK